MAKQTEHRFHDPMGKYADGPQGPAMPNLNSRRATGSYANQLFESLASGPINAESDLIKLREILRKNTDPKIEREIKKQIDEAEKNFKTLANNARITASNSEAQLGAIDEIQSAIREIEAQLKDTSLKQSKATIKGLNDAKALMLKMLQAAQSDSQAFFEGMAEEFEEIQKVLVSLPGEIQAEKDELSKQIEEAFATQAANDPNKNKPKVKPPTLPVPKPMANPKFGDLSSKFEKTVVSELEEAHKLLDDHATYMKGLRKAIESNFLKLADKFGIGFVTLGNAYRTGKFVGKALYNVGAFAWNPVKYTANSRLGKSLGRAGEAIRGYGERRAARADAQALAGGNVSNVLSTMLAEHNKGTDMDPRAVRKANGKPLKQGTDMDTMVQTLTAQMAKKKGEGFETDEEEKEFDKLNKILQDHVNTSARTGKRIAKAVEKQANKTDSSGGIISAIAGGIGDLGKLLGGFVGEGGILKTIAGSIEGLGSLLVPIIATMGSTLLVAGALYTGWKAGKWLYDKFLGDSPLFQNIIDKVGDFLTGGNAQGKDPNAPQDKGVSGSSDAMGTTVGGYSDPSSDGPAPADPGGQVVIKAAKGAGSAIVDGVKSVGTAIGNVIGGNPSTSSSSASSASSIPSGGPVIKQGIQKINDLVGTTFNKGGNVKLDGVDGSLQDRVSKMGQEYQAKTGKKLTITSGFRTPEDQARIKASGNKNTTADPGNSWHQYGQALDIDHNQVNELKKMGLLQKYGLVQPFPGKDPVHIQSADIAINPRAAGIVPGSNASMASASANMSPQGFTLPEPQGAPQAGPQGSGGNTKVAKATMGPNPKASVDTIPTFDQESGMLLSINVGLFA